MNYKVEVIIRNKKVARDPEGETIKKELVARSSLANKVKDVRSGKWLLFEVEAQSPEEAVKTVEKICREMRIYNPVVHEMEVRTHQGSRPEVPGH
ncbi:MAG: phosphoribosylformylglycinamidine synthase subunit PurS [Crenarchaeota archaeon]|nr:phosphoribosylformylglycinamidine synthase subunit PurS [Thermoproteota archaeon]